MLNIEFPPEERTIIGRTEKEVLQKLLKKPHRSYYPIDMIVIRDMMVPMSMYQKVVNIKNVT